jgi:hypothetical protein
MNYSQKRWEAGALDARAGDFPAPASQENAGLDTNKERTLWMVRTTPDDPYLLRYSHETSDNRHIELFDERGLDAETSERCAS